MRAVISLAAVALPLVACGSPSASASVAASASPEPLASAILAFCDPLARLDLRTSSGAPVVLSGFWAPTTNPYPTDVVHIALRQAGDCVWIVETLAFGEDPGAIVYMREFHGRLDPSFRITGAFADVMGSYPGDPWTYGPFTYRVEVSGDRIMLVEDREPSDPAPGCGAGAGSCPDPLEYVWVGPF